jgi:hypothetical protein
MLTRSIAKEYGDKGVVSPQPAAGPGRYRDARDASGAGINEISRIPREQRDPPERSDNVLAWPGAERPADRAGQDLHVSHPAFADLRDSAAGVRA